MHIYFKLKFPVQTDMLPTRAKDHLIKTLIPSMRNQISSCQKGKFKRLPKQYWLLLLSLAASQRSNVTLYC